MHTRPPSEGPPAGPLTPRTRHSSRSHRQYLRSGSCCGSLSILIMDSSSLALQERQGQGGEGGRRAGSGGASPQSLPAGVTNSRKQGRAGREMGV